MDIDPPPIRRITEFAIAVGDPDLAAGLTDLDARLRSAVPSYVGLTVLATDLDPPVTLTVVEHGTVGSSLSIEPVAGRVSLVVYALAPGAFVDLAADASWLLGPDVAAGALDEHLTVPPPPASSGHDLAAASRVQQAIGVLLARGHLPADAQRLLRADADRTGTDLVGAAAAVLASVGSRPVDDPVADEPGAA